ncbi:MAG: hypothetical protein E5W13_26775 [Mesorhizobium sp.]|nr:MAG: hypothetical protein E5W13_26775 [Mesorhizobium sp.]
MNSSAPEITDSDIRRRVLVPSVAVTGSLDINSSCRFSAVISSSTMRICMAWLLYWVKSVFFEPPRVFLCSSLSCDGVNSHSTMLPRSRCTPPVGVHSA